MYEGSKRVLSFILVGIFAVTLFNGLLNLKDIIYPGVSLIYNSLGSYIAPNMVTNVVFDWRGYDTLGETLILISAVLVILLIFGRGRIEGDRDE